MDYEHFDGTYGLAWRRSDPPHPVVFERSPPTAIADEDVGGAYSREAWFWLLGAAAWLTWGQIARRLGGQAKVAWTLEDLGCSNALPVEAVTWGLLQLTRHGLAQVVGEYRWRIQTVCPPLHDNVIPIAPIAVGRRRPWGTAHTVAGAEPTAVPVASATATGSSNRGRPKPVAERPRGAIPSGSPGGRARTEKASAIGDADAIHYLTSGPHAVLGSLEHRTCQGDRP